MARVSDRISRGEYSPLLQSLITSDLDPVTGITSRYHRALVCYLVTVTGRHACGRRCEGLRTTNIFVIWSGGRVMPSMSARRAQCERKSRGGRGLLAPWHGRKVEF